MIYKYIRVILVLLVFATAICNPYSVNAQINRGGEISNPPIIAPGAITAPAYTVPQAIGEDVEAEPPSDLDIGLNTYLYGNSNRNITIQDGYSQYSAPSVFTRCAPGTANWQVVTRVVFCIQETIVSALQRYIGQFSRDLKNTALALFALATVLFGIKIIYQPKDLEKMTLEFLLKFAIIAGFAFNMSSWIIYPFLIVMDMIRIVVGGWSPWFQLDFYIAKMIGTLPGTRLNNGLLGVIGAAMFSGVNGFLVFLVGIISVLSTLYFAFRSVFAYLSSLMLIAFLMLISPAIIPLALFVQTERFYFKKWMDLLIAAMITPVITVMFMWTFMGLINTMLNYTISGTLAGNSFPSYGRVNKSAFSWLMPTDPGLWHDVVKESGAQTNAPAVQTFMSPTLLDSMDANPLRTPTLDFGPNQVFTLERLTLNFLGLLIVSYVMMSMLSSLPTIAERLSGAVTGLASEGMPFVREIQQGLSKLKAASAGGGG